MRLDETLSEIGHITLVILVLNLDRITQFFHSGQLDTLFQILVQDELKFFFVSTGILHLGR